MREGLPGGEVGDRVGVEEAAQGGREVLGLPGGRGDGEDRPALTALVATAAFAASSDQAGQQCRARAGGDGDLGGGFLAPGDRQGSGDAGVAVDDVQQRAEGHDGRLLARGRQHERPAATSNGVVSKSNRDG